MKRTVTLHPALLLAPLAALSATELRPGGALRSTVRLLELRRWAADS